MGETGSIKQASSQDTKSLTRARFLLFPSTRDGTSMSCPRTDQSAPARNLTSDLLITSPTPNQLSYFVRIYNKYTLMVIYLCPYGSILTGLNSTRPTQVVRRSKLDPGSDSHVSGCQVNLIVITLFKFDIEAIKKILIFLTLCLTLFL